MAKLQLTWIGASIPTGSLAMLLLKICPRHAWTPSLQHQHSDSAPSQTAGMLRAGQLRDTLKKPLP